MVCAECPYWEECMGGCRFQKKAEEGPEPEPDRPYFSYNYYRNQELQNFFVRLISQNFRTSFFQKRFFRTSYVRKVS